MSVEKKTPVLDLDPYESGLLGQIIGVADSQGAITAVNGPWPVHLNLTSKSETSCLTYKIGDGPAKPTMPRAFDGLRDIPMSRTGHPEEGWLRTNEFIEKAAVRMMAHKPDVRWMGTAFWRIQVTGHDGTKQEFLARPHLFTDEYATAQFWERIFQFHRVALHRVAHDLAGKLVTTLSR